jgi:hypothetical protein
MCETADHAFTIEVDILKFDQESDRVVLNGFLGEIEEIRYVDNNLTITGNEAIISLIIKQDELSAILNNLKQ